jgi:DNA-3-methyladenine glycosylase II
MPVSKEAIKNHLLERDHKLKPLITSLEFPVFKRNRNVYAALLASIISQQLSVKAADTIHQRFLQLFPDNQPEPEIVLALPLSELRAAGISQQKAGYIRSVAEFALAQGLDYALLANKDDEEIIAHLTQIKGVGRWTVEMLLMFALNRKDVFAVDDLGIQNAMKALYVLDDDKKKLRQQMIVIAENWRPYRTVVCRYLWQWRHMNIPIG